MLFVFISRMITSSDTQDSEMYSLLSPFDYPDNKFETDCIFNDL